MWCIPSGGVITFTCISKVLEKIVFDNVIEHIQLNYISSCQFGFLPNRSILQQLIVLLSTILDSLLDKCQSDIIYLDIRKAFDSVPHVSLMERSGLLVSLALPGNFWKRNILPLIIIVSMVTIANQTHYQFYLESLKEALWIPSSSSFTLTISHLWPRSL